MYRRLGPVGARCAALTLPGQLVDRSRDEGATAKLVIDVASPSAPRRRLLVESAQRQSSRRSIAIRICAVDTGVAGGLRPGTRSAVLIAVVNWSSSQ
jgi:hypothetical protein